MTTSETPTRQFHVPAMSCDHCTRSIEKSLTPVGGVDRITIDLEAKTVTVTGPAGEADIIAAIGEAGYEVA